MKTDFTNRFTNRVGNYIKYRPGYPGELMAYLKTQAGLEQGDAIADVGAGTGIFTGLLLNDGYRAFSVEPNEAMRHSAEQLLQRYPNFTSLNGTAEATTLPSLCVDMVTCAQAFHWFRPDETKVEFKRILKSGYGLVALIWNNRLTRHDAFAIAYDELLIEKATDYKEINHQNLKDISFKAFYKNGEYSLKSFANQQVFDFEGLAGRAFSSSYVPAEDTVAGKAFSLLLRKAFDKYQVDGQVTIYYQTEVYLGRV